MEFGSCVMFEMYCFIGKELYSPDTENSPAPPGEQSSGGSGPGSGRSGRDSGKQTSRTNSFEIENLLKVSNLKFHDY